MPFEKFIVIERNVDSVVYVAIDNTTGDAWTEDFYSLEQAFSWINGDDATPKYKVAIIPSPQKMGRRWKR